MNTSPVRTIRNEALEINVVHHCNLSCRSCSHLSPIIHNTIVDPDALAMQLQLLAQVFRAAHIRLLGGEPTLHPELASVVDVVRKSEVAPQIRLVTNGTRLDRLHNRVWAQIDELHVSLYPGFDLSDAQRDEIITLAHRFGVEITWLYFDRFRESYAEHPYSDITLLKRVYQSCLIAHKWRCYTLEGGYFYKCPSAYFLPQYISGLDKDPNLNGVKIEDSTELYDRLKAYLDDEQPLNACRHCLGSVGTLFTHQQINRGIWRKAQHSNADALVDRDYLAILETVDSDADNLCRRDHTLDPDNAGRNWDVY